MSYYSDIYAFGEVFGPDMCGRVLSNAEHAMMSEKSPLVMDLCHYHPNAPLAWMKAQVSALNVDTGASRMSPREIDVLSRSLLAEYSGLKVTEILLFFAKVRAGHYGKFYGAVDGVDLANKFQNFVKWLNNRRAAIIAERDAESARQEEKRHAMRAVSRSDFDKMISSGFNPGMCVNCTERNCRVCVSRYK